MTTSRNPWRTPLLLIGLLIGVPAAVIGIAWLYFTSNVITHEGVYGGALVSAGGRTISATAGALCDETVTLTADEEPSAVLISLKYVQPRTPPCSGMPGFAVYHVTLAQPLGRRRLIDAVTGKPVPFIDVATIVRPAYLPPGYVFRYDAPDAADLLGYGYAGPRYQVAVSCSQLYTTSDDGDRLIITQSAAGGALVWPVKARPRRITVNGHPALVIPGQITWTEHGQRITVTATDPGLPAADLIAVADSMPA